MAEPFQMPLAEIEKADVIVLVGCNPRHEAPLLGHRVRKAWRHGGAKVVAINPVDFDLNFDLAHRHIVRPSALVDALLGICKAAGQAPAGRDRLGSDRRGRGQAIADLLRGAQRALILLGESAATHPQASWLRAAAGALSAATGARLDAVPVGANAVGLARAGALPTARNAAQMLAQPRKAWVLYGIEPEHDFADTPTALRALAQGRVVAFTAFADETTRNMAQVMLPMACARDRAASPTPTVWCRRPSPPRSCPAKRRPAGAAARAGRAHGRCSSTSSSWRRRERMTPGTRPAAPPHRAPRCPPRLECVATRAIYGTDARCAAPRRRRIRWRAARA